jgi:hypothetical protein
MFFGDPTNLGIIEVIEAANSEGQRRPVLKHAIG